MRGSVTVQRLQERRCRAIGSVFTLAALASVLLAPDGHAESEEIEGRLQKIRLEVSQTERTIGGLKSEFTKLKRDEKGLNSELQTLTTSEQDLTIKSQETAQRKERLMHEVEVAERKVAEHQVLIRDRLRSLYVHSVVIGRPQYIGLSTRGDLERSAVYARSIRAFDEAKFHDVKRAVDSLIKSREELELALRESLRIQGELQSKRTELETKRVSLQGVMKEIKEKQLAAQQSLAKLRTEATKMEDLLRSITTEEGELKPDPQPSPESPPTPGSPAATSERVGVVDASLGGVDARVRSEDVMHPEGLFGKSVKVSYPVKGQVLRSFGRSKVTDFSDIIFSKGMEFKTPESSQVKAVLGGRVAFSGSMPGYDMVVIIDHGLRSYSLYGRLGKAFVAKGDVVKRGTAIGVTSAPDTKGRNFYFETRKNGSPVDPSTVLARAS